MPNIKSLSLTVQNYSESQQTDRQTDRQTGQKQYAPDHSIRGHKNTFYFWPSLVYKQNNIQYIPGREVKANEPGILSSWHLIKISTGNYML